MTDKKVVSVRMEMESALASWITLSEHVAPQLPASESGWHRLALVAAREGCAGLLLEALERRGFCAPEAVAAGLRDAAVSVAADNLNNQRLLEAVGRAFGQAGVPLMALKGAALNALLYEKPGLRPAVDADLLIRPEDAAAADRLLARLNYRRGPAYVREDFYPRFHYEAHYSLAGGASFHIDLHVRPFRPLRYMQTVPADAFWESGRSVSLGETTLRAPGDEDMLLHLAVHAACHGANRLLWLVDIQRFAHKHRAELDWDRLLKTAGDWKLTLPLLRALRRTRDVLGQDWPVEVLRSLRRVRHGWRDRLALAQSPHDASHPVRHVMVDLLCTTGWRFRLAYLSAMLLPGADHMGQVYPRRHRGWLPVAYVLRWGRAAARPFGTR